MINTKSIRIKILEEESNSILNTFKSSDTNLNIFLRRKAKKHQTELLAVTYLLYNFETLIGYFSLSADTMPATDIEKEKLQNGKKYKSYPAIKIGRLAIAEEYAREGYESWLISAIKFKFANEQLPIGCRYLLVDAYTNALDFYAENDFIFWTNEDADNYATRLMYYDLMKSRIH